MKKLIIFSLLLSFVAYTSAIAQTTPKAKTGIGIKLRSTNGSTEPLYILDGVIIDKDAFALINPDHIEAIDVLKDSTAIATYGPEGVNGVILITTKGAATKKTGLSGKQNPTINGSGTKGYGIKIRGNATGIGKDVLVIVDDVEIESDAMNAINPDTINDIRVLKDAESTIKYGEKAQNGVILITTKEYAAKKGKK